MLYSTTMFKHMETEGGSITPRQGTYLVGVVNAIASLLSTQIMRCFGRRTLVIWGHIFIAIIHASIGVFGILHVDAGIIGMILAFLVVYQNSSGPVAWLYAAETTIDSALGICLFTLWGTVFILSLVCPILMDPNSSVGINNVFFIFSGLSVFGSLYCYFFIKESKGLTDKEKKLLFTPEKYK